MSARMGRRRVRRSVAAVAAVAVLAGGAWWVWWRDTGPAQADEATTRTVQASLTTLEKTVSGTGTLTPTVKESVSFSVPGTVTSVDVAVGDTVTQGQKLATVDTLELNADLLDAKATLVSAQATLANARDDDDRSDVAQARLDAAAAQVDVAQARYDEAVEAMAGATHVAPAAGLVTSVDLEVGDVVSASASAGVAGGSAAVGPAGGTTGTSASASTAQVVIVGTDQWQVSTSVDESDVALIEVGDQVEMTSDDLEETLFGVVGQIDLVSTSSTGVASFPVTVDVTLPTQTLHDGVSVDVEIIYERRTDVLTVPALAVTRDDDGTSQVTKLNEDGTTQTVTVETGQTSGSTIEIVSGLAEGDSVVVQVAPVRGGDGDGGTAPVGPGTGDWPELPDFGGGQMPVPPGGGFGELGGGPRNG